MKAPEKIYVHRSKRIKQLCASTAQGLNDIEYIRKDAFIEKACEWLKSHYRDYMHNPTGERLEAFFWGDMITDFENFLKGVKS